MGKISVGDQTLTFEQIAQAAASREYVLEVEYYGRAGAETESARIELDATSRREATKEVVTRALEEWYDGSPGVKISSFDVVELVECRQGERVATEDEGSSDRVAADAIDGPIPGVDADELTPGERVAYYVEGPHSAVYGYVAEGVVEKRPPWERGVPGKGELIQDKAVLDVGDRTREVPLAWIIGSTADDTVADAVDRQYPA